MNTSNDTYLISGGQRRNSRDLGTWLSSMRVGLRRLGASLAARHTRQRELQELYRFTDRDLWDVGLSRSDIDAIAKGTFTRD